MSVVVVIMVAGQGLGLRARRGHRALIHHGEKGTHQGESISHGMMKANHQRLTTEGGIHQVHLPQGALMVERGGGKVGHQPLQLGLASLARQDHPLEVQIEIEIGIVTPVVLAPLQAGLLVKSGLYPYGVLETGTQLGLVELTVKHQHTDDLHQIVGSVHPQPGGIDTGDKFTR